MYMDKEIEEFIHKRYFPIDDDTPMYFEEDEVIKLLSDFLAELDGIKQWNINFIRKIGGEENEN